MPSETLGPFLFDTSVFQSALDLVRRFLTVKAERGRMFFLDELGKLELERSRGLLPPCGTDHSSYAGGSTPGLGLPLGVLRSAGHAPPFGGPISRWGFPVYS